MAEHLSVPTSLYHEKAALITVPARHEGGGPYTMEGRATERSQF